MIRASLIGTGNVLLPDKNANVSIIVNASEFGSRLFGTANFGGKDTGRFLGTVTAGVIDDTGAGLTVDGPFFPPVGPSVSAHGNLAVTVNGPGDYTFDGQITAKDGTVLFDLADALKMSGMFSFRAPAAF